MIQVSRITRRKALKAAGGAVGATLPLVQVQSAAAADQCGEGIRR